MDFVWRDLLISNYETQQIKPEDLVGNVKAHSQFRVNSESELCYSTNLQLVFYNYPVNNV